MIINTHASSHFYQNTGNPKKAQLQNIAVLESLSKSVYARVEEEQTQFCTVLANALILESIEELNIAIARKEVNIDKSGKLLSLNDGRKLKAIFSNFNASMDTLHILQSEWRISSTELRENVRHQLTTLVVPAYSMFFNTYSNVPFSKKHSSEYLRYPPASVETIFSTLFN